MDTSMIRIEPPTERECERCGRKAVWDDEHGVWRAVEENGERRVGQAHCLHEWDINGTYNPAVEG